MTIFEMFGKKMQVSKRSSETIKSEEIVETQLPLALEEFCVSAENCTASELIATLQLHRSISLDHLAARLGTSLLTISRWQRGDIHPSEPDRLKLATEVSNILNRVDELSDMKKVQSFAGRGARSSSTADKKQNKCLKVEFTVAPNAPIVDRLADASFWTGGGRKLSYRDLLSLHLRPAPTISEPAAEGVSAGKNTYTYDAHTYHTKVPPQGIAEVISRYLPEGGLVLDPFSGSGMTGVASLIVGADVILNELSPAASFISNCFTGHIDADYFSDGVKQLLERTDSLRKSLYSTTCRECTADTEIIYTVWSYKVKCTTCSHNFTLWDECRSYGKTVKDHKILKEFPCPACKTIIRKSRLTRSYSVPVMLGYKCCSKTIREHSLNHDDLLKIENINGSAVPHDGFFPTKPLPDGANLNQPKKHGLTSIDKFYTSRNLHAMSTLWYEINCVKDVVLAQYLAFTFTSLYQRVTKMSEFRFWGGSGNTANFNVPYIFREANVFATFERKAKSIHDHLSTTSSKYAGNAVVHTGSATDLSFLPNDSVDLIFTDPPFGANINYSEMNVLWESWLGSFTDNTKEAIVSKVQKKDLSAYKNLMVESLRECHRVLRVGHWMIVVFMISSSDVWEAIRSAVLDAGFSIERVDIFDKQHGTFKQYVSDNTAGCDLMLHCQKIDVLLRSEKSPSRESRRDVGEVLKLFLSTRSGGLPINPFIHVTREDEIDYRLLYSEFLASNFVSDIDVLDFMEFRRLVKLFVSNNAKSE
jgi:DNA modification methylase/DNA-binding transcriptional regulator YiaG